MGSDVINDKSLTIIKYLFRNFDSSPHLRGIARNTGVSKSTTSRILSKLYENDVVTKHEQGNQTFFALNLDNLIVINHCALALALEFDGIKQTNPSLHKQLKSFVDSCEKINDIQSIVLFGSAARGEHGKKSDLDLLVLVDDLKSSKKIEQISSAINASYSHNISPTAITPDSFLTELRNGNLLYETILKEGIPIYGSENYLRTAFRY
ncbi:MAG: nucleotidyltransferase domain-containing protein [Thermoplasmata archaeon]